MTTMTVSDFATAHQADADTLCVFMEAELSDKFPVEALSVGLAEMTASVDETFADDLIEARDALEDAREDVRRGVLHLQEEVVAALSEGVTAARVGEILGVSRARVYQIRDGKR